MSDFLGRLDRRINEAVRVPTPAELQKEKMKAAKIETRKNKEILKDVRAKNRARNDQEREGVGGAPVSDSKQPSVIARIDEALKDLGNQ